MYICFLGVRPANTPKALYPEDQGRTLRNAIRRDAECLRIDGEELEADTSTTRKRVSWCEYDDMHGIGARRASECIRAIWTRAVARAIRTHWLALCACMF